MPSSVPISWHRSVTPPSPPSACAPKMPQAMPPHAPHRPCSGHTPSTSSIFQRFCVSVNSTTKMRAGDGAGDERADRMHHVGAGADRDQPGERPVVHEARVVAAEQRRGQRAARHRHQRVHRDQAGDLVDRLRAHHVEAEPADRQHPGAEREERNARRRMRADAGPSLRSGRVRAPSSSTAVSPTQPPTACTTTLPAKSWNSAPNVLLIQACTPKRPFQRDAFEERIERSRPAGTVAASCGLKRARSAMPPETIAGIAAAKVSRKKNLTSS